MRLKVYLAFIGAGIETSLYCYRRQILNPVVARRITDVDDRVPLLSESLRRLLHRSCGACEPVQQDQAVGGDRRQRKGAQRHQESELEVIRHENQNALFRTGH